MEHDGIDLTEFDDDTPADGPFLRATITARGICLNPPAPGIITGGPATMTLRQLRGRAVLVDLRVAGDDDAELIASTPPNAPRLDKRSLRRLIRWAGVVGYRRLWFPDGVVELEAPDGLPTAQVVCPTCTARWADSSAPFWEMVREFGHFPGYCSACGGSLPEWEVPRRRGRSGDSAGQAARQRATAIAELNAGDEPQRPRA